MFANGHVDRRECTVQDWDNIKLSFVDAVECLEGEDLARGVHLLRNIMRECKRILYQYRDPAVLFSTPTHTNRSNSPGPLTPTEERLSRDWPGSGPDLMQLDPEESVLYSNAYRPSSSRRSGTHEHLSGALRIRGERPTVFHSIYGCVLFLFGHIIKEYPSMNLTEDGEPKDPLSYFMAAIEVFEQAESLPTMTTRSDAATRSTLADRNRGHLEDWLMAIAWGRTLVALAHSTLPSSSGGARFPPQNNRYPTPSQSPRSSILLPLNLHATTPAPHTQGTLNAHDLLMQAQDHFMRGIFHMPHSSAGRSSHTGDSTTRRRNTLDRGLPQLSNSSHYAPPNRPQTRASVRAVSDMSHASTTAGAGNVPRPRLQMNLGPPSNPPRPERSPSGRPRVSRSRMLYTIGIEVLKVAERLLPSVPTSSQSSHSGSSMHNTNNPAGGNSMSPAHARVMRQRERDCYEWAEYADGVLLQLENELNERGVTSVNPVMVSNARGRCAQVIGRALMANREVLMDSGSISRAVTMNLNGVDEATYYFRQGTKALEHFERALRSATSDSNRSSSKEVPFISSQLTSTLFNLAKLSNDDAEKRNLYARVTALSTSYSSRDNM